MRALKICQLLLTLTMLVGMFSPALAQEEKRRLSEEEIQKMFQKSAQKYNKTQSTSSPSLETTKSPARVVEDSETLPAVEGPALEKSQKADVTIVSPYSQSADYDRPIKGYVRLNDINMVVDVSNKTIQEVIDMVVLDATDQTGPWQVKWRLRREHEFLLREKVNLTAESTFGEFIEHLVDRVNNMTGVHLFVTIFDASRIIIISDTYY